MPDFSTQMAQMIAQARPQMPTGGRGRPGQIGGGSLVSSEKAATGHMDVDAGAIARLFGYKTSKERQDIGNSFINMRQNLKDEDWDKMVDQQSTQYMLKGAQKSGVPGIIIENRPDGTMRYNVPKYSEEVKTRGLSETEILAGGAGQGPTKTLIESRKALQQPTEISILGGPEEQAKAYIGRKRQLETPFPPHESEINLRNRTAEAHQAAADLNKELLRLSPETFALNKQKTASEMRYHDALAKKADADALASKAELESGLTKPAMQGARQTDQAFDEFYKAWVIKNSLMPQTDDKSGFQKIAEMEGAVSEHIAGMKFYTSKGQFAERSIRRWFSLVDTEFEKPKQTGTQYWGISGKPNQAQTEQQSYRRYYVKKGVEMLKESDLLSGDGLINKNNPSSLGLARKVIDWARDAGMSDNEIDYLFQYGKFPTKQPAPAAQAAPDALKTPGGL